MGTGESKEQKEQRKRFIERKIMELPPPRLVFPSYCHMEHNFLENRAKLMEQMRLVSKIGGLLLDQIGLSLVSFGTDFILDHYSVENALLAKNIEKDVIDELNTLITVKLQIINRELRLLQAKDVSRCERIVKVNIGLTACREIGEYFSNEESHLFKNPLASAPILINLVPPYIALVIVYYNETNSETIRNDLIDQVNCLKRIVNDHM